MEIRNTVRQVTLPWECGVDFDTDRDSVFSMNNNFFFKKNILCSAH